MVFSVALFNTPCLIGGTRHFHAAVRHESHDEQGTGSVTWNCRTASRNAAYGLRRSRAVGEKNGRYHNSPLAGPAGAALMSLTMLIDTRDGRNYTAQKYVSWLKHTGFRKIRTVRFEAPGADGTVIGEKAVTTESPGRCSAGLS
jgi:hypothetical protein